MPRAKKVDSDEVPKKIYCVKCRQDTKNADDAAESLTKNGRRILKVSCAVCDTKKCRFLKNAE